LGTELERGTKNWKGGGNDLETNTIPPCPNLDLLRGEAPRGGRATRRKKG